MRWHQRALTWLLAVVTVACGSSGGQPTDGRAAESRQSRTFIMIVRAEPIGLAARSLRTGTSGRAEGAARAPWNATLTTTSDRGTPIPYLSDNLPELNTDTWRVSPDGTMETTYHLRAGLTWHDGAPFVADDAVFSWEVYRTPAFAANDSPPLSFIREVVATDERTVLIRWSAPFAEAGELSGGMPPLPRHILGEALRGSDPEAFIAHPFWGASLVGLGPYRLDRWESGAFIDGSAFDNHALGPPKIQRIRIIFMPDPNAAVATLLGDGGHMAIDATIRFEQGRIVEEQWANGRVLYFPTQVRWNLVQVRSEYASPKGLADLRFRRALAHAIDKQALIDGVLQGIGTPADTLVVPQSIYYPEAAKGLTRYPLDLRRTEQLMNDAGYSKGADGVYSHPSEGKIDLELWANQGTQNESEVTILADSLKRAGIGARFFILPQALVTDNEARARAPGLQATSNTNGLDPPLNNLRANNIPLPENRYRGNNRGGWTNTAFERSLAAFDTALAKPERVRLVADMLRTVSEDLPGFPLYYNFEVVALHADLQGFPDPANGADVAYNVYDWSWK